MPSLAWTQQSYDLINDLDLLVPAGAKSIDSMLEVDIEEIETDDELARIEATFLAARRSHSVFKLYNAYFCDVYERELRLLHAVTRLKRSEFDAIDAALKKQIRKTCLSLVQDVLITENAKFAGWKHENATEDAVGKAILETINELIRLAEVHLDAERAANYRAQIEARREFAKEAMIESMTASLALKFVFSNSQRERVEHLIRDNWRESWRGYTSSLIDNGVGSMPHFPKDELFAQLRDTQKVFFDSLQWKPNKQTKTAVLWRVVNRKSDLWNLANELEFAAEKKEQE